MRIAADDAAETVLCGHCNLRYLKQGQTAVKHRLTSFDEI